MANDLGAAFDGTGQPTGKIAGDVMTESPGMYGAGVSAYAASKASDGSMGGPSPMQWVLEQLKSPCLL